MITISPSHPSPVQLADFNAGRASPEDSDEIAIHLEGCLDCPEALTTMVPDPLENRVRVAGIVAGSTGNPDLARALDGHERYKVCDEPPLGGGGQGVVVKAIDNHFDRKFVAVKLIREESAERAPREIMALGRLSHPNIATPLDAGKRGGVRFLVMELLKGSDLNRLVKDGGPLPVVRACNYVQQAARGLKHSHQQGMVHRDIKPANLLASPEDWVKILDFGLVRMSDLPAGEPITQGFVIGTPAYMAPEQATNSHEADIRSDIYSLGCTLYYLLSGRVPFPRETPLQVLTAQVHDTPDPISAFRADVPQGLVAVLNKMMAKKPGDRFQTPAEVTEALNPFVTPRPPLPTWIKLVPAAVAASLLAVAVCLLVAGFAVNKPLDRPIDKNEVPAVASGSNGEKAIPAKGSQSKTTSKELTKKAWNAFEQGQEIVIDGTHIDSASPYFVEAIRVAELCIEEHHEAARTMQDDLGASREALSVQGASTVGLIGSPLGQGPFLAAATLFPRTVSRVKFGVGQVSEDEEQRIYKNWAVNDVATCLFIKGRSLEYLLKINQSPAERAKERIEAARKVYEQACELTFARCWDPKGPWFWNPSKSSADGLKRLEELSRKSK